MLPIDWVVGAGECYWEMVALGVGEAGETGEKDRDSDSDLLWLGLKGTGDWLTASLRSRK